MNMNDFIELLKKKYVPYSIEGDEFIIAEDFERLPFLIAEFLTENTSMRDIQRIIHSTIPESYKN